MHKDIFEMPKDFVWGAATASYQIEGAYNEDGRGLSTWDDFCTKPGKINNNDNGNIACDHYHRYKEDVQLMKSIGLNAYRFSISWSRIFPDGKGKINEKGLDFYDRLTDELLKNNITPFATLFHWDLPLELEKKYGGWRNKDVAKYFADYCATVTQKLSDRIVNWTTMNEIICFTLVSHKYGVHAPGTLESDQVTNQTIHNALYGHGLGVRAIRNNAIKTPKIGLVEDLKPLWPAYDTKEHINAAKKAWKELNSQILFPVMEGKYNSYFREANKDCMPIYTEEEMKIISEPMDYLGLNVYFGSPVTFDKTEKKQYKIHSLPKEFPKTSMGWNITPKAIYYAIMFAKEYFGNIPIYITENGMAANDKELEDGSVIDLERIEYLRSYLQMVAKAKHDGGNIKGYFLWSLLDNFEWSQGFSKRFGITRVNYSNQSRTLKLSGQYYSDIIKAGKIL